MPCIVNRPSLPCINYYRIRMQTRSQSCAHFRIYTLYILFDFVYNLWSELTENAFRNTRHCIIPSIVSPVRQNVPVRWRPLRPTAVANDACTNARRWPWPLVRLGGSGAARIILSNESITSQIFCSSFLSGKNLFSPIWFCNFLCNNHVFLHMFHSLFFASSSVSIDI